MKDKERDKKDSWEGLVWEPHKYNERKKLKSGSYLRSFCPHCDAELTRDNVIQLEVINIEGASGSLQLSPYLNVFEHKTDIKLPAGQEARDLRCPECHKSLMVERYCRACDSHAASFLIGISNTKVPFFICMREGCHWHDISAADETQIILDDSDEW
ncbi:MAG: hypothetical protein AB1483_09645 [Candidatus Zixiibacteriota bacterium]